MESIKFAVFHFFTSSGNGDDVINRREILRSGRSVYRTCLLPLLVAISLSNVGSIYQMWGQEKGSDGPFLASQTPTFPI